MAPNEVILMGAHGDVFCTSTIIFASQQRPLARSARNASARRVTLIVSVDRRCRTCCLIEAMAMGAPL
jgi:hypothetical protein